MSKRRSAHISTLGSQVTSAISVALVLLVLGAMAMVMASSRSMAEQIRANMGFIIKMDPAATDAAVNDMKKRLGAAPYVDRYAYTDPEAIMAEESEAMGRNLAELIDTNPYGAEFDVKVRPDWAVGDSINALARRIELIDAVEQVVTETAVIDSVNSVMRRLTWALAAVAAALLVISFVLISNAVSLAVYSRRFIIHTMKLVGATGAYIRGPFLRAGALTGAVAALIAAGLLTGLRFYLADIDTIADKLLPWPTVGYLLATIVAAGVLICTAAAAIATNRYLRVGYDDLYMK